MSRFHDHLISFTFEAHNLLPSCICQPFKRLSFTLWCLQIYWSGIVVILQVKSSTKLQKYTLYFNKCCFKLREFALKVPRYLSNYLLFFCLRYAVEATWKYISDNKDKYLPHSPAARLDFWFGQIFAAVWKRICPILWFVFLLCR